MVFITENAWPVHTNTDAEISAWLLAQPKRQEHVSKGTENKQSVAVAG